MFPWYLAERYERRAFLLVVLAGTGGYAIWDRAAPAGRTLPARVRIAGFDRAGRPTGVVEVASVRKSDSEWKRVLPLDTYWVTRRKDTELAFTGKYDKFYGDGLYRCFCCDTALFDSRARYASGTGWPAFTQPVAKENVIEALDGTFAGEQTEVRCRRCDAHLGHLFDDGPPPGGMRYCIDSVALRFVAREL